jgi:ankyrin repeat protein
MPEPANIRGAPMSADELKQWRAFEAAIRAGDVAELKRALGDPEDFPNTQLPLKFGVERPLAYAIDHAPMALVRALVAAGADVNHDAHDGFPALYSAVASARPDRHELAELLIDAGADLGHRGFNGYTALHVAATQDDPRMVGLLLARGADPQARTDVDDFTTPLEEAEAFGCAAAANVLRAHDGAAG